MAGFSLGQMVGLGLVGYWFSQPGVFLTYYFLTPLLVYLIYSYLDGSEKTPAGRYWPGFQFGALARWIIGTKGYMPGEVVYDNPTALDSTRQCIFGAFPHGVVSFHHVLLASDCAGFLKRFPHLGCHQRRDLVASVCFKIPVWRELLLWLGCVDAAKSTAVGVLRNGWSLYILPGGELEQMLTVQGEHHVYLKQRKGFVKLALEYGVDLVPVYAFGETDLYTTYGVFSSLRWWICKTFRVAIPLVRGWGPTLLPLPRPIKCVVGSPIRVEKSMRPSSTSVDALHLKFTQELEKLFNKHKAACGYPDAKLVIH